MRFPAVRQVRTLQTRREWCGFRRALTQCLSSLQPARQAQRRPQAYDEEERELIGAISRERRKKCQDLIVRVRWEPDR